MNVVAPFPKPDPLRALAWVLFVAGWAFVLGGVSCVMFLAIPQLGGLLWIVGVVAQIACGVVDTFSNWRNGHSVATSISMSP